MVQPGASLAVAVRDMDETAKFYHDVVGIDLRGDRKFQRDEAIADLVVCENPPIGLRGLAVVELEHAAEPRAARDRGCADRRSSSAR
jgi:catechol 2,3-dioxygenase-like lactoylglutathione lyase family enzyme